MLSEVENEVLTHVDKGTPMGGLLRNYWYPIAPSAELYEQATKEITLLGEDLVLFRDRQGRLGLIDRFCPHRRVNMAYGIPENDGLRCPYHGWKFDPSGACIEQPFEDTVRPEGRFKEKCGIAGYPVEEVAGLIFAYLGPQPAPALPLWAPLLWEDVVRDVAITELPCNWLQCMENSLDPVHVEWLHVNYTNYLKEISDDALGFLPAMVHEQIGFDAFEHGIIKRRILQGHDEKHDDWRLGHPILFPNILYVSLGVGVTLQFRVPVDDTHTKHVTYYAYRTAPGNDTPPQDRVPYRYVNIYADDVRFDVNLTIDQDKMAWITQGPVAERFKEKLGESDTGIILFRKMLKEQMALVEDGGEPINVFHDPQVAGNLRLPMESEPFGLKTKDVMQYVPIEAGDSPAKNDIETLLAGWRQELEAAEATA